MLFVIPNVNLRLSKAFRSLLAIYPEQELVVVILTNDTGVNFQGNEAFAELFME